MNSYYPQEMTHWKALSRSNKAADLKPGSITWEDLQKHMCVGPSLSESENPKVRPENLYTLNSDTDIQPGAPNVV